MIAASSCVARLATTCCYSRVIVAGDRSLARRLSSPAAVCNVTVVWSALILSYWVSLLVASLQWRARSRKRLVLIATCRGSSWPPALRSDGVVVLQVEEKIKNVNNDWDLAGRPACIPQFKLNSKLRFSK